MDRTDNDEFQKCLIRPFFTAFHCGIDATVMAVAVSAIINWNTASNDSGQDATMRSVHFGTPKPKVVPETSQRILVRPWSVFGRLRLALNIADPQHENL